MNIQAMEAQLVLYWVTLIQLHSRLVSLDGVETTVTVSSLDNRTLITFGTVSVMVQKYISPRLTPNR